MTLIELYDNTPLCNIIGVLALRPSNVIVVIPDDIDDTAVQPIRDVLAMKRLSVNIKTRRANVSDIQNTRRILEEIVKNEGECVIDLTGGDERLIAAATSVAEQYGVQSQHVDVASGVATDTDGDGTLVPTADASLTVREWITLHGGVVTACTSSPACTETETNKIWELACRQPREWNEQIKILTTLEKGHHFGDTVSIAPQDVPKYAKEPFAAVRAKLLDRGIIQDESTKREIRYRYTKPYYRSFLKKAGNLLEHKAFYEATATMHNHKPLFGDVCMGVSIDWNEQAHGDAKVTNNEIDLLLTHGVQPLFVSCKNGDVDENELYKLETVANRFGGALAKKMLIVTELEPDSPQARDALTQRAADMGIYLVANAGRLHPAEWKTAFLNAMGLE